MLPALRAAHLQAAGFGFLFVCLLQMAQTRFLWWPWHPAGFVMAQSGALDWMWCPIVIAGVTKGLLLRFEGLKLYRHALPFFVGLILGDYALSGLLAVLSWVLRTPLYKPFPI